MDTIDTQRLERGQRLARVRRMTGLSRRKFAQKFGIPASTLQNWEDGKATGLTDKGAQRFVEISKSAGIICSVAWLMHGIDKDPHIASKHSDDSSIVSHPDARIAEELHIFHQHYPQCLDHTVKDDGMLPYYHIGEIVAGPRYFQPKIADLIHQDCIIQTADTTLLRRLKPGTHQHQYTLACTNPNTTVLQPTLYDIEVVSAAPIIWIRRPMK